MMTRPRGMMVAMVTKMMPTAATMLSAAGVARGITTTQTILWRSRARRTYTPTRTRRWVSRSATTCTTKRRLLSTAQASAVSGNSIKWRMMNRTYPLQR